MPCARKYADKTRARDVKKGMIDVGLEGCWRFGWVRENARRDGRRSERGTEALLEVCRVVESPRCKL